MNPLNLLILLPLAAVAGILAGAPARRLALAAGAGMVLLALLALVAYDGSMGGYDFLLSIPVLPDWGISYALGADGLSLMMLALTAVVTLCAVAVAPRQVENEKAYFSCLLLIAAGAAGAFASTDLFFFYIFHELALIPTFLLIGMWGTGERQRAAWKITIYLAAGSFVLLVGLLALYFALPPDLRTFDLTRLPEIVAASPIAEGSAKWIALLLILGFGVLISLFPFHTWAPDAYASAPVPAAMLHAGVLKKFGLYGLIRVAVPLVPEGMRVWTDLLLLLLLGNILVLGLATIAQRQLDKMLGYSSVMHMGYAFLGIASLNATGIGGTALLLVAHGLSIALLFALAGEIRQRTGSLDFSDLGGMATCAPFLGLVFGLAAFASVGLPGFANFAAELLIFFGAFGNGAPFAGFNTVQIATVLALWGVVISAVYMLRAYRSVFMGTTAGRCKGVTDLPFGSRWPLVLLVALLLLAGCFPRWILDRVNPSLKALPTLTAQR